MWGAGVCGGDRGDSYSRIIVASQCWLSIRSRGAARGQGRNILFSFRSKEGLPSTIVMTVGKGCLLFLTIT